MQKFLQFCLRWMGYAETPTGARVCKGEAQGVLSYQNLKGIFTNAHMLYGERGDKRRTGTSSVPLGLPHRWVLSRRGCKMHVGGACPVRLIRCVFVLNRSKWEQHEATISAQCIYPFESSSKAIDSIILDQLRTALCHATPASRCSCLVL